ncbi:MAG: hypothetical protein Kow00128_19380 [Deltaproteobacteria bacterium]
MTRNRSGIFAILLCAALAWAIVPSSARGEVTVHVNDPAVPGVFDQPSVAINGSTAHVAYIGGTTTAGPFLLYYAAINGGSNFSDLSLTRDTAGFLVTPPVAIDNTDPGNDPYVDARHPQILLRSATDIVILFQAKAAASPNPEYLLYLARLTIDNNAVVAQSVRAIAGLSGFNEDVSFGLVSSDNTARIAYAGRPSVSDRFDLYFARVSLDNAAVTGTPGTPLLLTSTACGTGTRPLPSLKLDDLNRAHVAWAANNDNTDPSPVCYALVKETSGADNVVISGTQVLGRSRKWGTPNLLVNSRSSIAILGVDESAPGTAGNLGMATINPDADDQDGSPVLVQTNTKFLPAPGEVILPDSFDLYRPTAFRDTLGTIHMSGYGNGLEYSTYYAFKPASAFPYGTFGTNPMPVGLGSDQFPAELAGDYTRGTFGFITSGKAIAFWSGEDLSTGSRNLNVTGIPTLKAVDVNESGCSAAGSGGSGFAAAILLLVPAGLLGRRRHPRRHGAG